MPRKRLFIVSLPRSGSTVLTTMLDRFEDVLCLPESLFPALLESISEDELRDPVRMAGLFIASCLDGSPLTLAEAKACMAGTKLEMLEAVESKVAEKFGRPAGSLKVFVWKYTRYVGQVPEPGRYAAHFVILRRDPLNVFESQFRVDFGVKNRNAARFALFEASYTSVFDRYPPDVTLRVAYSEVPSTIPLLLELLGSSGERRKDADVGVGGYSGSKPWHSDINKPFNNSDSDKLRNLSQWQIFIYRICRWPLSMMPWIGSLARKAADARELGALRRRAASTISMNKELSE